MRRMLYECGSCSAIITPYIRVRISLEPFIPTLNIALPLTRPELQRSQGVELGLRFWVTERQNTRWHFSLLQSTILGVSLIEDFQGLN